MSSAFLLQVIAADPQTDTYTQHSYIQQRGQNKKTLIYKGVNSPLSVILLLATHTHTHPRTFHVLLLSAWVLSRFSGFPPTGKEIPNKWTGNFKLPIVLQCIQIHIYHLKKIL